MSQKQDNPKIYGITSDNSSRYAEDLWGKNQFNSTFPLSLCLYMRDEEMNPISVRMIDERTKTDDSCWTMCEVIGKNCDNPFYQFEKSFKPYAKFSRNKVDKIDLIVSLNGIQTIPLEVKLTVVPDMATSNKLETEWAPEIVMRPVSSAHAMMSVASALINEENQSIKNEVIKVIKPAYNRISDWDNEAEVIRYSSYIHGALKNVLKIVEKLQKPFLLNPIWRTKGQSLELCEQCFDVFAWSDVAVMGIPMQECSYKNITKMTRTFREVTRHIRSLYDILQTGDYDYSAIYKGMSYGMQTDKAFTISGNTSIRYLNHDRLTTPLLPRKVLHELILNGGESKLKPERRFDAAVQVNMMD
ncbi:MAG: HindVP family restriction endonuclease [Aestuariivita sp.]|nr:HindVP family restriction endonuclease [Aestuariivita sp.]